MSGHDVLIVGAGPTGLTLALALARAGVSFRIIDRSAAPAEESRALAIHARSLEIFSQLGVVEPFLREGTRVAGVRFFARGRAVGSVRLDDIVHFGSAYPFILNLEQRTTEQILLAKLKDLGVLVERNTELVSLNIDSEGARVALGRRDQPPGAERKTLRLTQIDYADSPAGSHGDSTDASDRPPAAATRQESFRFVVGCDGARSTVRHLLGIEFRGGTYEHVFLLADARVRAAQLSGDIGRSFLTICVSEFGPTAIFPLPGPDRFRVISVVPSDLAVDRDHIPDLGHVQEITRRNSGMELEFSEPEWISVYRLHHRRALAFRKGPFLIAGDAAHVHSPAGGQGMNTGIQDAWNLGWKLAMRLRNPGAETLLDTYHEERHRVAGEILAFTDRFFQAAVSANPLARRARLLAAPLGLRIVSKLPRLRRLLLRRVSQVELHYRGLRLASRAPRSLRFGPRPGSRAPGGLVCDARGEAHDLHELLEPGKFHLVSFPDREGLGWDERLLLPRASFRRLVILPGGSASPATSADRPDETFYYDDPGPRSLRSAFRVRHPLWVVIRPDGHVACGGRFTQTHADLLTTFVQKSFGTD